MLIANMGMAENAWVAFRTYYKFTNLNSQYTALGVLCHHRRILPAVSSLAVLPRAKTRTPGWPTP